MSSKRNIRKIFLMFVLIMITTVTLVVETYAWFVGISSVSVNNFDISVSSGGGLELSLDGSTWNSDNISISKSIIEAAYAGNTNKWTTNGLSPVSTNGQINSSSSKLNLYQKTSLSATDGGYRLIANQIDNSTAEQEGYIAFDLFIRNGRGTGYSSSYDPNAEEDIYLTANSDAIMPISGQTNYGVANSLRVGFFEIGRVSASTTNESTIRSLNCSSSPSLCSTNENLSTRWSYTWNIWEPNYAKHATSLVTYFNNVCKFRDSTGVYYITESCLPLESGTSKRTYAVNSAITSNDNVDIYDGISINSYTSSKLTEMKTYKTTDATATGNEKQALLRLAGNSITKVRVYIWLEGQDIDNYDIISKNQTVRINFGLTKDRYGINDANTTGSRASSFEDDSWEEIQANVRAGTTSQYNVGDTRNIRIGANEYTLRLMNKSSPSGICNNSGNSQTACGFVVEFADVVEQRAMNSTSTNAGGWPGSELYTYVQGDFYNSLPTDLKDVIIPTRVVSGHGSYDSNNFITNDKLYLLSGVEMVGADEYDTSASTTRQLDYYAAGLINLRMIKKYNGSDTWYWLRPAQTHSISSFRYVGDSGNLYTSNANYAGGLAPAFRIG